MTEKFGTDGYGNVYGADQITPTGRAAWVYLDKKSNFGTNPKYSVTLLFSKSDEKVINTLDKILTHYSELVAQKVEGTTLTEDSFDLPSIRDGDDEKYAKYQGFAGSYFLTAKNASSVEVVGPDKKIIEPSQILPGMLVRAVITPMCCSKGAAYKLKLVQLVKDDGTRFYGGPDPKSLLDVLDSVAEEPKPKLGRPKLVKQEAPVADKAPTPAAPKSMAAALNKL